MKNKTYRPGRWRIVKPENGYNPRPPNVRIGPAVCSVEKAFTAISIHAEPTDEPCPDVETLDAIGEANALLIVAAPDLRDALEGLLEIGKRDLSNPKYDSYFLAARAAIEKSHFHQSKFSI